MTRVFAILLLCVPASAALAQSGSTTLKSGPATLTLAAPTSDAQIAIPYAPVPFTVTVEGATPLKVKLPKKWTASEAWHVFPKEAASEAGLGKERMRWRQTFFLEPLTPGAHELQLEPLQVQLAPGPWQTIAWPPIKVTVRSPQTEADTGQLRDITSIEELPPARSWVEAWPWLAAAVGLLIALGLAVWAWRRRRRRAASLSPEDWARQEIDRLVALDLPGRGATRRFHALLSNVLRRYLERRFLIPARRQTTPEFLHVASQDTVFTPAQQQLLRDVLERCDLAKFAGAEPSPADCAALAERTRAFIGQTAGPSTTS